MSNSDPSIHPGTSREQKRRACDVCKRRKVRCTGDTPCENCVRHGVVCRYTMSHGRLAQNERRISYLQSRIRVFEEAWKQFVPHIDLTTAVRAVEEGVPLKSPSGAADGQALVSVANVSNVLEIENMADTPASSSSAPSPSPDLELEDADTLDWDESLDVAAVADGIGSLSMNSTGIGYMGPQSGNALLRKLQSISVLYFASTNTSDELTTQRSPETGIPDHVLNSSQFMYRCVDWYFKYYHCAYPILHEGHFRAQLMGALPKPRDGSWPILLNTVLAIGAHSGEVCEQNADIHFYREASQYLSWDKLHRGTLSLVQAFALLANYLQKRNRPNSGFTLLGVAVNMAQGLGLHREFSGLTISAFDMEIRRRVWWTLFIFDSGARVTFGRPTLSLGGINTKLPRNLEDNDLAVDLDEIPRSREVRTISSCLIWQAKLAKIGNRANEKLLEKQLPDQATMIALGEEVSQWATTLPGYMRAEYGGGSDHYTIPRMILLWRSMHLRVVIHRPFLLDHIKQRRGLDFSDLDCPASRCFNAAEECVQSILRFSNRNRSRHGSFVWYACYWLVTAVFVHVTCLLYEPQNASALTWRQQIEKAKVVLDSMGPYELTALRAAQILEKIMSLVPTTPDSTIFAINEPIRMEVAEIWNQSWADMVVPQESPSSNWF